MNPLDTPLNLRLPAKLAKKLEKAGINTVGDLLLEAPRRYYHWGALTPMHILRSGEDVTILAEVVSTRLIQIARGQECASKCSSRMAQVR